MQMPGGFELVIIVLVILLLFGAKRIPELARGLGQGIQEFRKASDDIKKEIDKGKEDIDQSTRRSEEHTSELQSRGHLVCRLLLEKKKKRCKPIKIEIMPIILLISGRRT